MQSLNKEPLVPLVKIVIGMLLLMVVGLPILTLWKTLLLLTAWIALACSDLRLTRTRFFVIISIIIVITAVRGILPRAAIEEGHNIFLVNEESKVLEEGIPVNVYNKWRDSFLRQYNPKEIPNAMWLKSAPSALYAWSSDSLWEEVRYSRVTDTIKFSNLSEFRGGFSNESKYGFIGSDPITLARSFQAELPFYVMYQLSQQSVGSKLVWTGSLFWEEADGSFREIHNASKSGKIITEADKGKRVYLLHLPKGNSGRDSGNSLELLNLELSSKLLISKWGENILIIIGCFTVLGLSARIRKKSFLAAMVITAISLGIIMIALHFSQGKYIGPQYPPHGGGDDGLSHESMGRQMAREFMSGNIVEAMRGGQSVYWDTPGMRYVRMVEKIIFGDTNLGYMVIITLFPLLVHKLLRCAVMFRWAAIGTIIFMLSPLGSLSFMQYIQNAKLGYAETAAVAAFLSGLILISRSQPAWGGEKGCLYAFWGGALLALSMFLRPNFAIAVPLLGLIYIIESLRIEEYKLAAASAAGLALALWMPFHNYFYGHQYILISLSGATIQIALGVSDYLYALQDVAFGNWRGDHLMAVGKQLSGWLWTLPRLPFQSLKLVAEIFMILKLVTLVITLIVAITAYRTERYLFMLAWVSLAAHAPMLIIHGSGQFRYGMLGWDLSALLTILLIGRIDWGSYLKKHLNWRLMHCEENPRAYV